MSQLKSLHKKSISKSQTRKQTCSLSHLVTGRSVQGQDSDEEENDDYGVEVRPPKPFVDTPLFNMCKGLTGLC